MGGFYLDYIIIRLKYTLFTFFFFYYSVMEKKKIKCPFYRGNRKYYGVIMIWTRKLYGQFAYLFSLAESIQETFSVGNKFVSYLGDAIYANIFFFFCIFTSFFFLELYILLI